MDRIKVKMINEKITGETGKLKGNRRRWKEGRGIKKKQMK